MKSELDWSVDDEETIDTGFDPAMSTVTDAAHYVVTAQPPGAVLQSVKCSFLAPGSVDVIIAKSRRLEIRQLTNAQSHDTASLPVVLSAPINGRITSMLAFRHPSSATDYLFFTTETKHYAVLSYVPPEHADSNAVYNLVTHAHGTLNNYGMEHREKDPECGPIASLEPNHSCIALHLYEGFVTILPICKSYQYSTQAFAKRGGGVGRKSEILGHAFHCRIEEKDVYSMAFLLSNDTSGKYMPQLAFLHQDSRGNQHVIAHSIDLQDKAIVLHSAVSPIGSHAKKSAMPPLVQHRLKKNRVDGGSGHIIAVPPVGWEEYQISGSVQGGLASNVMSLEKDAALDQGNEIAPFGGVLILGEQQITYHDTARNVTKTLPMSQSLILSCTRVHPLPSSSYQDQDVVRYLLGDEGGRLHVLAIGRSMNGEVKGLYIKFLGITNVSSSILYLERGLVFIGSQTTDSQFIQILDESARLSGRDSKQHYDDLMPSEPNQTLIHVLDEYTNLGPIVDFDIVPITHNTYSKSTDSYAQQCIAVTASGTEKDGSIRLVRNGTGLIEHASIDLGGIKGMWNLRKSFYDLDDAFLVQSYIDETRILGVVVDQIGVEGNRDQLDESSASLAEIDIPYFDTSKMTLFAGNVILDTCSDSSLIVQITKYQVQLISLVEAKCLVTWHSLVGDSITIATANESGQIVVVAKGGKIVYLQAVQTIHGSFELISVGVATMDREISCVNLNPFDERNIDSEKSSVDEGCTRMDIDDEFSSCNRKGKKSKIVAVGFWDEDFIHILSLDNLSPLKIVSSVQLTSDACPKRQPGYSAVASKMIRSLCLVTLGRPTASSEALKVDRGKKSGKDHVDIILIGLGDGTLISYLVTERPDGTLAFTSKKEVRIGTRALGLCLFQNRTGGNNVCVLATGDRPTVIYLSSGSVKSSKNTRLCYSNIHLSSDEDFDAAMDRPPYQTASLVMNVATPFYSSLLFGSDLTKDNYSLCVSDESVMRLGVIDNIQKLHVMTHKLGMPPRKVAHDLTNRLLCVACIDNNAAGIKYSSRFEYNMGNCIRFFDDTTFEEIDRVDLDPYEMILSLVCTNLRAASNEFNSDVQITNSRELKDLDKRGNCKPCIILGTGYGFPEDSEASRGRIIVLECSNDGNNNIFSRKMKQIAELQVRGGVFSVCPFFEGSFLASINTKTRLCRLVGGPKDSSKYDVEIVGAGHHGHVMSLHVRSLSDEIVPTETNKREQLAIVGDMVRSVSVLKYYPEFQTLEEIARDFNQNWVTALEMLTDNLYLGAENFNNIFTLRRNPKSSSEEIRCRLDTTGVFHIGEMVNKFMKGSLVLPSHKSIGSGNVTSFEHIAEDDGLSAGNRTPTIGAQILFGTVDGTLGSIIGLDVSTANFFIALQKSMSKIVTPVGELKHGDYRSFRQPRSCQRPHGFIDGDFVEAFAELDPAIMNAIVEDMNKEGRWYGTKMKGTISKNVESHDEENPNLLTVDDVLAMIDDMTMVH